MRTLSIALATSLALAPTVARADDDPTPPVRSTTGPSSLTTPAASYDPNAYVPPRSVLYQGGEIPRTAHIETRPNMAYIGTGLSIFGSAYATSLIYGVSTCSAQMKCRPGSGWLYMPLVGPFITSAQSPTTGGQALAAFDGGVQALGAALTIVGFVVPRRFVTWQNRSASLTILPTVSAPLGASIAGEGRGGAGAGLSITLTHL